MTPASPDLRLAPYILPAQRSHAKFYPNGPFVSITLAQGIIESAWFTQTSGTNNFFGIKSTPNHGTLRWTHETLHGQYVKIPQWFADYPTIEAGFDAHAKLLTMANYAACTLAPTPAAYAHALLHCGYATGIPGHPYDTALIAIMDEFNLYHYDAIPTSTKA